MKFFKLFKRKKTPDEIFSDLKKNRHEVQEDILDNYYNNMKILSSEFIQTGQIYQLKKVAFLMQCVEKEKEALKYGINKFIFRDDIDEFLKRRDIKESSIKLIELKDYPRRIPSDIQQKIKKTKKIYTKFYVMFTDYTSTVTKNYMREKEIYDKDTDPILFGVFSETKISEDGFEIQNRLLNDKFYVIGDWKDEYCDLTLDKFVELSGREDVVKSVEHPVTIEEIKAEIERIK